MSKLLGSRPERCFVEQHRIVSEPTSQYTYGIRRESNVLRSAIVVQSQFRVENGHRNPQFSQSPFPHFQTELMLSGHQHHLSQSILTQTNSIQTTPSLYRLFPNATPQPSQTSKLTPDGPFLQYCAHHHYPDETSSPKPIDIIPFDYSEVSISFSVPLHSYHFRITTFPFEDVDEIYDAQR